MKKININRKENKTLRHNRFLKKLKINSNTRARLIVTKTNANLYAQILDPVNNNVLVYVSSLNLKKPGNIETAKEIGTLVAQQAKEKGINEVVFDRNGHSFHGQIKAIADAAREGGLSF